MRRLRPRGGTFISSLSFAFALVAVLGLAESSAHAQRGGRKPKPPTQAEKDKKAAADKAAAEEEEKRKAALSTAAREEEEKKKKADDEKKAADAAAEESKKKEWDDTVEAERAIYASIDLAFTRSDLALIVDDTGFSRTGANGVLWGISGGYRVKDFRIGLRWRVYDTTEFSLWSFAVSAGYALKMRPVTPIFSAHLGYVFDQKLEPGLFKSALPEGNVLPPDVDVKGLLIGADANASYWVTKWLRLGAFLGIDLMLLSRAKATFPPSLFGNDSELQGHPLYTESGTSLGMNFNLGLRGAFDIGLQ